MRYAFIKSHHDNCSIQVLCKILDVSRAGYYQWLKGRVSKQAIRRQAVLEEIQSIHVDSRGIYGSPRVHQKLKRKGIHINHKTVESIMQKNGIRAKRRRKFKVTTDSKHNLPVADNLLQRQFNPDKPNQAWVSDITYIGTDEGWLYLATFIDLYSRKVLGWSMSSRINADLVLNAFRMALSKRGTKVTPLVHSDRGSQYASDLFRAELEFRGCQQSMSRKADCWDNSVAESFFGSLKVEMVHHEKFRTRQEAQHRVFDYIEVFYNRQRLHSTLNYMSPEEFETKMQQPQAA